MNVITGQSRQEGKDDDTTQPLAIEIKSFKSEMTILIDKLKDYKNDII